MWQSERWNAQQGAFRIAALIGIVLRSPGEMPRIGSTSKNTSSQRDEFLLARNLYKTIFGVVVEAIEFEQLPPEMTAEWQLCYLVGDGATQSIPITLRDYPHKVSFLAKGLERLKTGLDKAGLSANYFPWPPKSEPNRVPYRGLKPLDVEDGAIFFGRDAEIISALDTLRGMREKGVERLLVIRGTSGSGKSSFMRAGLLPRLMRDDLHFFLLPVIRPRNAVLSGLEDGLAKSILGGVDKLGVSSSLARIKTQLSSGSQGFSELLADLERRLLGRLVPTHSDGPPMIVLPIDQAEELFNPGGADEAENFLKLLASQLATADSNIRRNSPRYSAKHLMAILTIRSDRYDRLLESEELRDIRVQPFDLRPIALPQYERVINGPAERMRQAGRKLITQSNNSKACAACLFHGSYGSAKRTTSRCASWREFKISRRRSYRLSNV